MRQIIPPRKAQRTLKQRLFRCMLALAVLLSLTLCAGLFLFGRFNSPKEDISKALELQMNVFENDMISYKDVMELLDIKQSTIKYHNKNIYETLGVKNLKQLIRYTALMRQDQREENNPKSP